MTELRELRVYMLGVGITACLLRIGMILWPLLRSTMPCRELVSLWSSFWS